MKREDPPETARRPGQRGSKFDEIRATLLADEGQFYNITEDLQAGDKPDSYFQELARSITAGNRAAFKPRGRYEATSEGKQIWARALVLTNGEEAEDDEDAAED